MGLGPYLYIVWFGVLLGSLLVAISHLIRSGVRDAGFALAALVGALMSWWFIAAYVGALEVERYGGTGAFWISLGIGVAGLVLFVWSCARIRNFSRKSVHDE